MEALLDPRNDALAVALDRALRQVAILNKTAPLLSSVALPEAVEENDYWRRTVIETASPAVAFRWIIRDLGRHAAETAADPDAALDRLAAMVCYGAEDASERRVLLLRWWVGLGKRGPYARLVVDEKKVARADRAKGGGAKKKAEQKAG